jgi:hypothetical protein
MNAKIITGLGAACLAAATLVVATPAVAAPAPASVSSPTSGAQLPVAAGIDVIETRGLHATVEVTGTPGASLSVDVDDRYAVPFLVDGDAVEWATIGVDGKARIGVPAAPGGVTAVTVWIGEGHDTHVLETTVDRSAEEAVTPAVEVVSVQGSRATVTVPTVAGKSFAVTNEHGQRVTGGYGSGAPTTVSFTVQRGTTQSYDLRIAGQPNLTFDITAR